MRTRRARRQRKYWLDAAYHRRQKLLLGAVVRIAQMTLLPGAIPATLVPFVTELANDLLERGTILQFHGGRKLFDVDRSYVTPYGREYPQLLAR